MLTELSGTLKLELAEDVDDPVLALPVALCVNPIGPDSLADAVAAELAELRALLAASSLLSSFSKT